MRLNNNLIREFRKSFIPFSLMGIAGFLALFSCGDSINPSPIIQIDTVYVTDTVTITDTFNIVDTNTIYIFLECEPEIAQNDTETKIEIQAECTELSGDWHIRRSISGFTGAGYIVWEGSSSFSGNNAGQTGKLTYNVSIPKAGIYRFNWRTYIAKFDSQSPNSEHNDSWLRIPEAADFYGKKGSDFVYPNGSGKTPNPEGSSGNGFFKVYMNRNNEWSDQAKTSDNDGYEIFARFDTVGTYTLEIARRSNWHAIDKFWLTLVE